jgi:hypothetical protein
MFSSFHNPAASSRLIAIGLLALVLALCVATKSEARSAVTLEFDVNALVSDNPFLTTEKERATGAVELVARPRAELQLDPRTNLDFTGEVGFRQYSRRYGNFVTGRSDLRLRHRRSEYLTINGQASYARDLVSDSLTDSIDFAVDTRQHSRKHRRPHLGGVESQRDHDDHRQWRLAAVAISRFHAAQHDQGL